MNSWSRLVESDLGRQAKHTYDADPARAYHNWDHVLRLYWHAEHTFGLPYDADLDMAVLAHDVIYDADPDKEKRSAEWLRDATDTPTELAVEHILKTIDHIPSSDNRMVLLDLADFTYPDRAEPNLDKIRQESIALYGITDAQFLQTNIIVMGNIRNRISTGLHSNVPVSDAKWFHKILAGIDLSIRLARTQSDAL